MDCWCWRGRICCRTTRRLSSRYWSSSWPRSVPRSYSRIGIRGCKGQSSGCCTWRQRNCCPVASTRPIRRSGCRGKTRYQCTRRIWCWKQVREGKCKSCWWRIRNWKSHKWQGQWWTWRWFERRCEYSVVTHRMGMRIIWTTPGDPHRLLLGLLTRRGTARQVLRVLFVVKTLWCWESRRSHLPCWVGSDSSGGSLEICRNLESQCSGRWIEVDKWWWLVEMCEFIELLLNHLKCACNDGMGGSGWLKVPKLYRVTI